MLLSDVALCDLLLRVWNFNHALDHQPALRVLQMVVEAVECVKKGPADWALRGGAALYQTVRDAMGKASVGMPSRH